ncbi:MAG TPA: hypothetical protein VKA60_05470 [Blastocatellia bacterium]|nr:hypothetical protein [Blastocatellia bacterium]
MLKNLSSLTLSMLLIGAIAVGQAYGKANKDQERAAKTKQKISKLGVSAPVIVKMTDGRKLNGNVLEINDASFVLLSGAQRDRIDISYSEVKQVKYNGSTGGAHHGRDFLVAVALILFFSQLH